MDASDRAVDVSYTSIVLWVEMIRILGAHGCGPLGGANAALCRQTWKIGSSEVSHNLTLRTDKMIQDGNSAFSSDQSVSTLLLQCRSPASPPTLPYPPSSGVRIVLVDIKGGIRNVPVPHPTDTLQHHRPTSSPPSAAAPAAAAPHSF